MLHGIMNEQGNSLDVQDDINIDRWYIRLQTEYNPVPLHYLGIMQTYPILKNNSSCIK